MSISQEDLQKKSSASSNSYDDGMEKLTEYQLTEIGLILAIVGLILACISETRLYFPSLPSLNVLILLFFFGSFVLIFLGRKEFGDLHEKYVVWSAILFFVGVVIVGSILNVGSIFSIGLFFDDASALRNIIMVYGMSFVLMAVFVGVCLMLLVWALESKTGKILLFSGFLLRILVAVSLCAMLISMFATVKDVESAKVAIATIESKLSLVVPFAITHHLLNIIAYFMAYMKVRNERKEQISAMPPV